MNSEFKYQASLHSAMSLITRVHEHPPDPLLTVQVSIIPVVLRTRMVHCHRFLRELASSVGSCVSDVDYCGVVFQNVVLAWKFEGLEIILVHTHTLSRDTRRFLNILFLFYFYYMYAIYVPDF
jgi:hypothetical protein